MPLALSTALNYLSVCPLVLPLFFPSPSPLERLRAPAKFIDCDFYINYSSVFFYFTTQRERVSWKGGWVVDTVDDWPVMAGGGAWSWTQLRIMLLTRATL